VTPTRTNRWWAERYNVNNAWIFNGNNGNLNNNNVNNANRVQAVAILPIFKVLRFYHDRDFVLCFVAQRDAFYQKEQALRARFDGFRDELATAACSLDARAHAEDIPYSS
jgi:hypothetical protein